MRTRTISRRTISLARRPGQTNIETATTGETTTSRLKTGTSSIWKSMDPDIKAACFGRPPLPPGTLASNGPPKGCIVDKINQFLAELKNPKTDYEERIFDLTF